MNTTKTEGNPQVALHFAFPAAIEEDVIDFCHEHAELMPGFTMFAAEGFGASGRLLTAVETVMGRAHRRVLVAILAAADVEAVLVALRGAIPSHDVVYWTTPVEQFGRLA
jgi:hypothetical protein